jgi:hypothetical protein
MIDEEALLYERPRLDVVQGLPAILVMRPLLVDLAERCGQRGAMDYLKYFLTGPYIGSKIPYLVLVYGRAVDREVETAEDLVGAVIVQEYRVLGAGSGIFMTDDENGDRTVIADPSARAWVTAKAAAGLLEGGAKLILLSLEVSGAAEIREIASLAHKGGVGCSWGAMVQRMDQYLPLLATLDETLATLGKHTRRNLRYYRRRAEEKLGCVFVPEVEMGRAEFLAVNRVCSYPVPDKIAAWRYDSTQEIAGRLFVGVRSGSGEWLSLIGGRSHGDATAVAWQMNREEMESYSLSTVMRSYLLQYEVERGTRRLFFDGGTPHSIHHAFVTAEVAYAVASRRSPTGALLRRGAATMLPKNNFLRRVLLDDGMRWHAG